MFMHEAVEDQYCYILLVILKRVINNNELPEVFSFIPAVGCQSSTILLIGDSMIHWLAAFAHREGKQGLGSSANVFWRGRRGRKLGQVIGYVQWVLPYI